MNYRKIFKVGHSACVTIPEHMLEHLNASLGDHLIISASLLPSGKPQLSLTNSGACRLLNPKTFNHTESDLA